MTDEQFSKQIHAAAETGDWFLAERACRARAWWLIGRAVRRGFVAMATQLHLLAPTEASREAQETRRV